MDIYQHNVNSIRIGKVKPLFVEDRVAYVSRITIITESGEVLEINLLADAEEKLGLSC